jgi:hypothetical protein
MVKANILIDIERFKLLAEELQSTNKSVYIKTVRNDLYFGEILFVGDETIEVECFGPTQRAGQKFVIYWASVVLIESYKSKGEMFR